VLGIEEQDDHACTVHVNRGTPKHIWKLITNKQLSNQLLKAKADPQHYSSEAKWVLAKNIRLTESTSWTLCVDKLLGNSPSPMKKVCTHFRPLIQSEWIGWLRNAGMLPSVLCGVLLVVTHVQQ
jgi:hypothetical protein